MLSPSIAMNLGPFLLYHLSPYGMMTLDDLFMSGLVGSLSAVGRLEIRLAVSLKSNEISRLTGTFTSMVEYCLWSRKCFLRKINF